MTVVLSVLEKINWFSKKKAKLLSDVCMVRLVRTVINKSQLMFHFCPWESQILNMLALPN